MLAAKARLSLPRTPRAVPVQPPHPRVSARPFGRRAGAHIIFEIILYWYLYRALRSGVCQWPPVSPLLPAYPISSLPNEHSERAKEVRSGSMAYHLISGLVEYLTRKDEFFVIIVGWPGHPSPSLLRAAVMD